jgi:hypothetical protein
MPWYVRIALGLVVCSTCIPAVVAQEPPVKAKAKVELRWVESQRVEGLTEDEGFQSSCDPDSIVYPHKKPALVLTAAEVAEARLTDHMIAGRANYLVTLHLTKEARDKLAATCEGKEMRLLTVVVDGKCWGLRRYEKDKDKPFVPAQARAETFLPDVGFFSSKADAERLVDAFK